MPVFGIHNIDQLKKSGIQESMKGHNLIAIDLYDQLDEMSEKEKAAYQERILLFSAGPNNTYKRTYLDRFSKYDSILTKIFKDNIAAGGNVRVHDIGVSDGRTSVSFFNLLKTIFGRSLMFTASDYMFDVKVLTKEDISTRVVVFNKKNPPSKHTIQVVKPPFVINLHSSKNPLMHPLEWGLRKIVAPKILNKFNKKPAKTIDRSVSLICNECKGLMDNEDSFNFMQYDLLSGSSGPYEIIRIMNVLNPSYFSNKEIDVAIKNIKDSLVEGGLLVIGSNKGPNSDLEGGVYKKINEHLEQISAFETISPIHEYLVS